MNSSDSTIDVGQLSDATLVVFRGVRVTREWFTLTLDDFPSLGLRAYDAPSPGLISGRLYALPSAYQHGDPSVSRSAPATRAKHARIRAAQSCSQPPSPKKDESPRMCPHKNTSAGTSRASPTDATNASTPTTSSKQNNHRPSPTRSSPCCTNRAAGSTRLTLAVRTSKPRRGLVLWTVRLEQRGSRTSLRRP